MLLSQARHILATDERFRDITCQCQHWWMNRNAPGQTFFLHRFYSGLHGSSLRQLTLVRHKHAVEHPSVSLSTSLSRRPLDAGRKYEGHAIPRSEHGCLPPPYRVIQIHRTHEATKYHDQSSLEQGRHECRAMSKTPINAYRRSSGHVPNRIQSITITQSRPRRPNALQSVRYDQVLLQLGRS